MRSESDVPFEDNPFHIPVADRVKRLPPYLFGKINKLKYQKRVAGVDVIDLGMGNPTDPPDPLITEKLAEALNDPRNHRYSVSDGLANLRREVAARYFKLYGVRLEPASEIIACIGSKEGFSHLCLALMGPGDTAIVPAPSFPVHVYAVMLAAGNVIALDVQEPDKFLTNIAYTCEHLFPRPKLVVVNFPHNPTTTTVEQDFYVELVRLAKKYEFLVISDFAYADICFDGYKAPSFLSVPGALDVGVEFTTMSKGYSMAGWRIGFCCGQCGDGAGTGHDQGVLRLRHFPAGADRGDRRHAALRGGGGKRGRRVPAAAGRALRRPQPPGLGNHAPAGDDVCVGENPRTLRPDGIDRLRDEAARRRRRRRQPGAGLRRRRRRLPAAGGRGKQPTPAASRPPNRPLPETRRC